MANRLLRAYLNKYEHREYLALLFGRLFDDVGGMKSYVKTIKARKARMLWSASTQNSGVDYKSADSDQHSLPDSPEGMTRIIEDHFSMPASNIEFTPKKPGTACEEDKGSCELSSKVIIQEQLDPDKLTTDDALLICDFLIESANKRLLYMPMSIRYLCKLVEHLVLQLVLSPSNPRMLEQQQDFCTAGGGGHLVPALVAARIDAPNRERSHEKLRRRSPAHAAACLCAENLQGHILRPDGGRLRARRGSHQRFRGIEEVPRRERDFVERS